MIYDLNWNAASLGSAAGVLSAVALVAAAGRWPNTDSTARLNIRFIVMALNLVSLVAFADLLNWIPATLVGTGLIAAWIPIVRRAVRIPRLLRKYGWLGLAGLLTPLLESAVAAPLPDLLRFHVHWVVVALFILSWFSARRSRWLLQFVVTTVSAGVAVGGVRLTVPVVMAATIAYFFNHASRGDKRTAAVILLPVLAIGVAAHV